MQKHKYNIFPEMNKDDYARLLSDLQSNGYDASLPIWLYEGDILDGWNRQRACNEIGLQPVYADFVGSDFDAIYFVLRTNKRRNLNSSQWACIAVEAKDIIAVIAKHVEDERRKNIGENNANQYTKDESAMAQLIAPSQNEAQQDKTKKQKKDKKKREKRAIIADTFNTNSTYVDQAEDLLDEDPETFQQVKAGEKTLTEVEKEKKAEKVAKEKAKKEVMMASSAKVLNCDFIHNINILDSAALLPKNINLLLTDPPYGMAFKSNRRTISQKDTGIIGDDNLQEALDLLDNALALIEPNMAANSFAFVFTGWRYEPQFRVVFEKYFTLRNSIVWVKPNHGTGDLHGSFAPKHERILFGVKGNPKLKYRLPDVLTGSQIETEHPASKPIDLLLELINVCTNERDMIIEPFAGHGSTIIAALKANRQVFAAEIDQLNYNYILNNINANN